MTAGGEQRVEGYGWEYKYMITSVKSDPLPTGQTAYNRVEVDIEYPKGNRVSGDIIHVHLRNKPNP